MIPGLHAAQRVRLKEVAELTPAFLSTVIKIINNADLSEYPLAAISIWLLLVTVIGI